MVLIYRTIEKYDLTFVTLDYFFFFCSITRWHWSKIWRIKKLKKPISLKILQFC